MAARAGRRPEARVAPQAAAGASDGLAIFLAAPPGLEAIVAAEACAFGFDASATPGGAEVRGDWRAVWRANLWLRTPTRVLVRLGAFRAVHLAQLDKRARRLPWTAFLTPETPVRVEASCRRSRLYHSGAVAARVAAAAQALAGARQAGEALDVEAEGVRIFVRVEDNLCTVSVDSSGALLHKRGFRQDVNAAPLRETLAAAFLRACGYEGREPLLDPFCGSGAIVLEAAEIAAGLAPGRARRFAFERLASFDPGAWAALKEQAAAARMAPRAHAYGFDRDAAAIALSRANAARAGVEAGVTLGERAVSALDPPTDSPGLVLANPPYGARLGDRARLPALYEAFGRTLRARFSGWRVGVITSAPGLARATRLPFGEPGPPIPHGGLRVRLYQTPPLR